MWQRFTENARKAVFDAQKEGQQEGEGFVTNHHLVLALLVAPDCTAFRVLVNLGVQTEQLKRAIQQKCPPAKPELPSQDMTLTPQAKRLIDHAYNEARGLNNSFIGTEHLLLGAILESYDVAGQCLAAAGVRIDAARLEVIALQLASGVRTDSLTSATSTNEAIDILANSLEQAKLRGDGHISTEHLLLAILRSTNSAGHKALVELGMNPTNMIEDIYGRMTTAAPPPRMSDVRTPRMNRTAALAAGERTSLKSKHLNSVHLLLGLLGEGGGIAGQVLSEAGVTVDALRKIAKRKVKG